MAKKIKGKDWFTIIAPKFFDEKVLGETPVDEPKKLMLRIIETPLIDLISDVNKFYIKMKFRITKIAENKAYTEFAGLECLRDYISRMVRHGIDRIDTVQTLITEDSKKIIVKTIIITNKKVTKGIEKSIRNFVEKTIEENVNKNKLDDFLEKVIDDSLRNSVLKDGSKIYPLRNFDIRRIEMPLKQSYNTGTEQIK
jgi:small subunit ribosomal protein S3Ae